jgi:hypothetical protein
VSRRRPKTLADEAQRYAERVVKKVDGETVPRSEFKLELVMAYMAGALRSAASPLQKELT